MNLSLLCGIVMVITWAALVFGVQVESGWVHLLYAGAVLLFARRILVGAPKFTS
jgi:hypothetical protein